MDAAILSTVSALAGTAIGAMSSLFSTWMTTQAQARTARLAAERAKREEVYGRFMDELAHLYASALNVGRDHIGSLINTLALAYFGGSMPLIVLLSLGSVPLSLALNSETIVISILSVLIASIGLVLCVPITTAVAVLLADRRPARSG